MKTNGNGFKNALHFVKPPQRVISLVPSLTESLFDLGLGEPLIAITDYCIHPAEGLVDLPRVGSTKNPRQEEILDLKPDLVLANWEENTRQAVDALQAADIPVWVTFSQTVRQSLDTLWTLVGLFRDRMAAARLETLEVTLDWAISAANERSPVRFFCPIWYEKTEIDQPWWMTFNQETYSHDMLKQIGGLNVFAERERRYPLSADLGLEDAQDAGDRDTRYPRLPLEEIQAAQPDVILLPDEPFPFDEEHQNELQELLADTPAAREGRLYLVDGSLVAWHGTRLARAVRELSPLLDFTGA